MAQLDDDEDTFIGRRFRKILPRFPIDLSLGYYPRTEETASRDQEFANQVTANDRHHPSLSTIDSNDVGNTVATEHTKQADLDSKMIVSLSGDPSLGTPEPPDQVTVDRFLRSTVRPTGARNYKQALKKRVDKKYVGLNDSPDSQSAPIQSSAPKLRNTVSRSRAQHRVGHALLVSGVKRRRDLASPPVLHPRWQPVKKAQGLLREQSPASVDRDQSRSNSRVKSRVNFLPLGWNDCNQVPRKAKAPSKPNRPSAATISRPALTFETIEEHDKKLNTWFGYTSSGTKRQMKAKLPSFPASEVAGSGLTRLDKTNNNNNNLLNSASNANKASRAADLTPCEDYSAIEVSGQGNQNELRIENGQHAETRSPKANASTGQNLTSLGDMLGVLRLSAKEFYHTTENLPSAAG